MDPKSMLILAASSDIEVCETDLVRRVAAMYDLNVVERPITTSDDLATLGVPDDPWDIIYACGHGDADGIGDREGPRFFEWADVAAALCTNVSENAWFFLSCCHSGLPRVGFAMFCGCPELAYVFGPRWVATPEQLACAFHVLMHGATRDRREPERAAKRASSAIDLTIRAFSRAEVTASDAFQGWCQVNGFTPPSSPRASSLGELPKTQVYLAGHADEAGF